MSTQYRVLTNLWELSVKKLTGRVGMVACIAALAAVTGSAETPAWPNEPGKNSMRKPAAFTARVYAGPYTVPKEILAGKSGEWLQACGTRLADVPMAERYQGRLIEVLNAALAVRVGGEDAGKWGRTLYGQHTVARGVYEALGRALADDMKALPALIDAVPLEEGIGTGWRTAGRVLRRSVPKLGGKVTDEGASILIYAGYPYMGTRGHSPIHAGTLDLARTPEIVQQAMVSVILETKGKIAWQNYRRQLGQVLFEQAPRVQLVLRRGTARDMAVTRPLAQVAMGLCTDRLKSQHMRTQMAGLLGKRENDGPVKESPEAKLKRASSRRKAGVYAEALTLYREAEADMPAATSWTVGRAICSLLAEAEKKGTALPVTLREEVARRAKASGAGASLVYGEALLLSGDTGKALPALRHGLGAESATSEMRLRAWALLEPLAPGEAWGLARGIPQAFASGYPRYMGTALMRGVAQGDFAGAAEWVGEVRARCERPQAELSAREAILWCAAGDPGRAEKLLAIPLADRKQALRIHGQFLQYDQQWATSGNELCQAAAKVFHGRSPQGSCWPMGARYALRILADSRLRREEDTLSAWTSTLARFPVGESKENAALARQLSEAVLDWAGEVLPVAPSALKRSVLILGGRPPKDTVRAECVGIVVAGSLRILADRGVAEEVVKASLLDLVRSVKSGALPVGQQKVLRVALSDAYPNLGSHVPEPRTDK